MKYVFARLIIALLALASAVGASYLVVTNTTDEVNYAVAMLALVVMVLAWIPVVIASMGVGEEWASYCETVSRRRRMAKRRHPSRVH
jgi:hypothetical protein